jgi:hypothetical protein
VFHSILHFSLAHISCLASKNKNISDLCRCINKFKKHYQHRTKLVEVEKGGLLAESHILNKGKAIPVTGREGP